MGGVSALVMLAAMGVTYGWQPDGSGGVEYVIQIPPEQLDELQKSGEITSVIDPAVRGHVSRVVVKIGRDPLSRDTPRELAKASAADLTPLPTPELDTGTARKNGVLAVNNRSPGDAGRNEVVRKPQTGGSFSMPPSLGGQSRNTGDISASLQNSTQSAFGGAVDRAAAAGKASQALLNATNSALGRNPNQSGSDFSNQGAGVGVPTNAASGASGVGAGNTNSQAYGVPGARNDLRANAAQLQPPAFAGSNPQGATTQGATTQGATTQGAIATTRSGGPSTDPTSDRDRIWYNPDGSPRTTPNDPRAASVTTGGSQATLVGPPDLRSSYGQRASGQSDRNDLRAQQSPTGYGTTTNFGRLPDGLQVPRQMQNASADPRQPPNSNVYGNSLGATSDANDLNAKNPRGDMDPSFDARNLPPGTYALNVNGQPIDREGRVLDPFGRPVDSSGRSDNPFAANNRSDPYGYGRADSYAANERTPGMTGRTDNRAMLNQPAEPLAGYGQRYPADSRFREDNVNRGDRYAEASRSPSASSSVYAPVANREATVRQSAPAAEQDITKRTSDATVVARPASDQAATGPGSIYARDAGSISRPRSLATQPLFNGLLLVSFVANVYLFFWLKNLRHQFRDLVAAKRLSKSGTPA